jgi:predicted DNA-binding transcriptional regulator YafY
VYVRFVAVPGRSSRARATLRRTERLFALAEALRARRSGVTAEALAERFGVTVRTIYRDLDALRAAALPLHAERGRGGGFALDRAYTLPPVNFSAREAALLVVAGRWLTDLRILPFADTMRGALEKVQAALPERSQRELGRLEKSLSWVGVPTLAPAAAVRSAVEQAWFEDQPLWIAYDGARGRTERTVRIEQVVMDKAETRLNCFDLDKQARRQFQLHKVLEARVAPAQGLAGG